MPYRSSGVTVSHRKRDLIAITTIHNGIQTVALLSYDQAWDLKNQLIDFLGTYTPDDE